MENREHIVKNFLDFFSSLGYTACQQAPLITSDKSLLFTNATIVPWKKYVVGETIPERGVMAMQQCLRLRVLEDPITIENQEERFSNRFLGYFNMLGVLTEDVTIVKAIPSLLIEKYGIKKERIKIFAPEKDTFASLTEFNVEYDTLENYIWQYGIKDTVGRGATIALKQQDNTYKEIGQLIEIQHKEKKTYEFGFGLETFITRKESYPDYRAWTISSCVPERYRFKTLLDLYSCFGASMSIEKSLLTKKHRREIRRLSRRIAKMEDILKIDSEITNYGIDQFIKIEFNKNIDILEELSYARRSLKNE